MVNEIQQYRKTNTSPSTSLSDTLGNMFLWGKKITFVLNRCVLNVFLANMISFFFNLGSQKEKYFSHEILVE